MSQFEISGPVAQVIGIIGALFGYFVMIFWMWIGWRAMLAHERIADALQEQDASLQRPPELPPRA